MFDAQNYAIGPHAGCNCTTGTGNFFCGYLAGWWVTTESNQWIVTDYRLLIHAWLSGLLKKWEADGGI